jgi:hypothetical protein
MMMAHQSGSTKRKKVAAVITPCFVLWHKQASFSTYTIGLEMFTILTALRDS